MIERGEINLLPGLTVFLPDPPLILGELGDLFLELGEFEKENKTCITVVSGKFHSDLLNTENETKSNVAFNIPFHLSVMNHVFSATDE